MSIKREKNFDSISFTYLNILLLNIFFFYIIYYSNADSLLPNSKRDFFIAVTIFLVLDICCFLTVETYYYFIAFLLKNIVIGILIASINESRLMFFYYFNSLQIFELALTRSTTGAVVFSLVSLFLQQGILSFFWGTSINYYRLEPYNFVIFIFLCYIGILLHKKIFENKNQEETIILLDEAVSRLTASNLSYLNYATNVKNTTIEEERKSITRELHDVTGKGLTNIIAMIDATTVHPLETESERKMMVQWIREQAQSCLQDTRSILYQIRTLNSTIPIGIPAIKNLKSESAPR